VSCCKPRLGRRNVWTLKLAELLSEFAWQRAVSPFFLEQGADGLEGWMLHELNTPDQPSTLLCAIAGSNTFLLQNDCLKVSTLAPCIS